MPYTKQWGHKLKESEGWELEMKLEKIDGFHWKIYSRKDETGWRDFKLRAEGRGWGRMNYTFGWNAEEHRFAGGKEIPDIKDNRPELWIRFCAVLKEEGYIDEDYEA